MVALRSSPREPWRRGLAWHPPVSQCEVAALKKESGLQKQITGQLKVPTAKASWEQTYLSLCSDCPHLPDSQRRRACSGLLQENVGKLGWLSPLLQSSFVRRAGKASLSLSRPCQHHRGQHSPDNSERPDPGDPVPVLFTPIK